MFKTKFDVNNTIYKVNGDFSITPIRIVEIAIEKKLFPKNYYYTSKDIFYYCDNNVWYSEEYLNESKLIFTNMVAAIEFITYNSPKLNKK